MKGKSYSKSPNKSTPFKKSPNRSFISYKQVSPSKSNQSFISFTDNQNKFFNPTEHLLPETTEKDIEVYKELLFIPSLDLLNFILINIPKI